MTQHDTLSEAIRDATERALGGGDIGEKILALPTAIVAVLLFHPGSWLLGLALGLTILDWFAGVQAAKKEGTYNERRADVGWTTKGISWAVLIAVWLLAATLMRAGADLGIDLGVTWVLPVYFTLRFMHREMKSLDENLTRLLGAPSFLRPLIDLLAGIASAIAPKDKP